MTRTKQETIALIRDQFNKITDHYHLSGEQTWIDNQVKYKKYLGNFLTSYIGGEYASVEVLYVPEEFSDMEPEQIHDNLLQTIGHTLLNSKSTDFLTDKDFTERLNSELKSDDTVYNMFNYLKGVQSDVDFFYTEAWLMLNEYMMHTHPVELTIPDFSSEAQLLKALFIDWCQTDDARACRINIDILAYPERACLSLNNIQDFDMYLRNHYFYDKDRNHSDYTDEVLQDKIIKAFGVDEAPESRIIKIKHDKD